MPFEIVRNDICNMQVDAIVNTANPRPVIGAGTDSAIHQKAGPELLEARQRIGHIPVGSAAITPAFGLSAKYVIHTVGPVWEGGACDEAGLLRRCYENSLELALEHDCRSVAFPLISTGSYGFPKDQALQIAVSVFSAFLLREEMQIYLVVFDRKSFRLSEKLFQSVASYINENYVEAYERKAYGRADARCRSARRSVDCPEEGMAAPCAASALSLQDFVKEKDAGFTETLLSLIEKSGHKNSVIYKKANISKQHFSKLMNDPDAKPSKQTAIALALALELNLEQTRDLIGRAGYALTNSSTFDLIIRYFIEHRSYNIIEINIALYEFDQVLLGSV